LAIIMAPIGFGMAAAPAGATSSHTLRPMLALSPRTFPTAAVTFNVTTTADTHDANTANPGCADSTNQCSLRAGLEEANASGLTTVINLGATNYPLTLGELVITDPAGVEIVGLGSAVSSITPEATDSVLSVQQGSTTSGAFAALTNLTVKGATNANDGGALAVGDSNGHQPHLFRQYRL